MPEPTPAAQASPVTPTANGATRAGIFRYSAAHFLIGLILLLASIPILEQTPTGQMIEVALFTLVLASAVLAVGARRKTLLLGLSLVIPAIVGKWLDHYDVDVVPPYLITTAASLFLSFVIFHLLRFILVAPRINSEVLCAAVAGYLLLGMFFGFVFVIVGQLDPNAFAFGPPPGRSMFGTDAAYFSFITLNTVGYGDITPVSRAAKMLTVAESTAGLFYMTLLMARLVSLYSSTTPESRPSN